MAKKYAKNGNALCRKMYTLDTNILIYQAADAVIAASALLTSSALISRNARDFKKLVA